MKRIKFSSLFGAYVSDERVDIEHGIITDITDARRLLDKGVPNVSHAMTIDDEMYETLADEYYFTDEGESPNVLPENILKDCILFADTERAGGATVEINKTAGYVAIRLNDGTTFYFQGDEAYDILSDTPDNISEEDWLLSQAIAW